MADAMKNRFLQGYEEKGESTRTKKFSPNPVKKQINRWLSLIVS